MVIIINSRFHARCNIALYKWFYRCRVVWTVRAPFLKPECWKINIRVLSIKELSCVKSQKLRSGIVDSITAITQSLVSESWSWRNSFERFDLVNFNSYVRLRKKRFRAPREDSHRANTSRKLESRKEIFTIPQGYVRNIFAKSLL